VTVDRGAVSEGSILLPLKRKTASQGSNSLTSTGLTLQQTPRSGGPAGPLVGLGAAGPVPGPQGCRHFRPSASSYHGGL